MSGKKDIKVRSPKSGLVQKEVIATLRVLTLTQAKSAGYKPVTGYFGLSDADQRELKKVLQDLGGVHVVLVKNPSNEFEQAIWRKSFQSAIGRERILQRNMSRGIGPCVRSK